jgi:hypothetical protein
VGKAAEVVCQITDKDRKSGVAELLAPRSQPSMTAPEPVAVGRHQVSGALHTSVAAPRHGSASAQA